VGAGIFLITLMAGLWLFIGHRVASGSMELPPDSGSIFIAKLYVSFALFAIGGAFGIGNGVCKIQRGKFSVPLAIVTGVTFATAISFAWQATNALPPG
jgi:hypothetical protein